MMRIVADKNELEYGKDVKLLTVGNSNDLKIYFNNNPNTT